MEMRQELQALISKYGDAATMAKELRKLRGGDVTKRSKMEAGLDKVISDHGTISLSRFKKEATRAWHRAFPDGLEKRELKGYQLFVKEKMPDVKTANPNASHYERMSIIGRMWQASKGVAIAEHDDESDMNPEPEEVPKTTAKRTRKAVDPDIITPRKRRAI
jgi:hypothetical protein